MKKNVFLVNSLIYFQKFEPNTKLLKLGYFRCGQRTPAIINY